MFNKKLLFAWILLVLMLMLPAAMADGMPVSGDGNTAVVFYVDSYGDASISFTQTEGRCTEISLGSAGSGTWRNEDEWGKYHFDITAPSGSVTRLNWDKTFNGGSFGFSLGAGTYQIRVTPYTASEMTASWAANQFGRWIAPPVWQVSDARNCTAYTAYTPEPTPNPSLKPARLTVYCCDENGTLIKVFNQEITSSQYVSPPALSNYQATIAEQYVTYNPAAGTCSPRVIYFYYVNTAPSRSASLSIVCYDENSSIIRTETKTISADQWVSPPSISGYTKLSTDVYVTLNSYQGTCTPPRVSFYYRKSAQPAPTAAPRPAPTAAPRPVPTAPPQPAPAPDPSAVAAYAWDTKFKPGVSTQNPGGYDILHRLYDDNPNTVFSYFLYDSDRQNGLPDFTAYFDHAAVSGLRIRNGHATRYWDYMRVHSLYVKVFTANGTYTEHEMTIPDAERGTSYYSMNFSRTYTDVTSIEIYITSRTVGSGDTKYYVHIRDLVFY